MGKQRYVNTRFWDDPYIVSLPIEDKLLFLYFLTTPVNNIAGIYEITLERVSFDTRYPIDRLLEVINRFQEARKIFYLDGFVIICNFAKHQSVNPKILQGISLILAELPKNLIEKMHSLSIPYQYASNYTNVDTNVDTNIILSVPDGTNAPTNKISNGKTKEKKTKVKTWSLGTQEIFNYWNNRQDAKDIEDLVNFSARERLLKPCQKITPDIEKALEYLKRLGNTLDDVKYAIGNYAVEICSRVPKEESAGSKFSTPYYLHRFSLLEFLTQKNGFSKFNNK